jgi:hypothetical protein
MERGQKASFLKVEEEEEEEEEEEFLCTFLYRSAQRQR